MLTNNLFSQVLIDPALQHKYTKPRLRIVSGFATASMAHRHLEELKKREINASIELIVGMAGYSGIELAQHMALCELVQSQAYGMDFSCRYIAQNSPVHAKTYVWLGDSGPFAAFCGSANYTITGFIRRQIEAVTEAGPVLVSKFYEECLPYTIDCLDETVPDRVPLTETRRTDDIPDENAVTLSLLVRGTDETHKRSGLNWGQRPGRDPNQAYIPIPAQHYDFFPEIGEQFTAWTDDDFSLVFVRAQQRGKALHTTPSNARLGEYMRRRLRVPLGEFVTKQHLIDYGRTDVTFTKIDEETYLMDFSPNIETEHNIESGET